MAIGVVATVLLVALATTDISASVLNVSGVSMPTDAPAGMHQVFADDFAGNSLDGDWFAYSGPVGGSGGLDEFSSSQVSVNNGELVLSATKQPGGTWLSGGVSSRPGLDDLTYGAYFVRMKATAADGVSDVAMLWPVQNSGPGETDFVEDGGGAKTTVTATFHYVNSGGLAQTIHSIMAASVTQWHTWGVVVTPNQLTYYLDGSIWAIQTSNDIPVNAKTFAIQTQVWGCNIVADLSYESCPDSTTPSPAQLDVAWVVADAFNSPPTAVPVSVVSSVSPSSGPVTGGNEVAIHGSGFTGATKVMFGTTPAASFAVESSGTIEAVAPTGDIGTIVDVTVTTNSGPSAVGLSDEYSFVAPAVSSVSPSSGPVTGGNEVAIHGSGFTGATKVMFGTTPAASFTVESSGTIEASVPAHGVAPVNVTVTGPDGTSGLNPSDEYSFVAPAVSSVSPSSGPVTGGNEVAIHGSGFTGATKVMFGTTPAASFTVESSGTIEASVPAHGVAPVNVTVTGPDGTSGLNPSDEYSFVAPAVSSVSPSSGPVTGGNEVAIHGSGFTGATKVMFGTTPAASFTVESSGTIEASVPAHGVAPVNVTVTGPDGTSGLNPSDEYSFVA